MAATEASKQLTGFLNITLLVPHQGFSWEVSNVKCSSSVDENRELVQPADEHYLLRPDNTEPAILS
jgi:hypothetical protein